MGWIRICACYGVFTVCHAGYGDAVQGIPNMREREVLALTNMARTAPQQFRDRYLGVQGILLEENYPAQPPLYWHSKLGISARAHSEDMAQNNCFQHPSCDGTPFQERMKVLNPEQKLSGENIAASYTTGFAAVRAWLLDRDSTRNPAADLSSAAGHRTNIMRSAFKVIGVGYVSNPAVTRSHLWVQDFGDREELVYPVASGAHFSAVADSVTFAATWYAGSAPRSGTVMLNGVARSLELWMGIAARGTYALTVRSGCYDYFFEFEDVSGQKIRYPQTDTLSTDTSGRCFRSSSRGPVVKKTNPERIPWFDLLGRFWRGMDPFQRR